MAKTAQNRDTVEQRSLWQKTIRTDKLPAQVTSYDILKSIAILLMIIDHIGYYLVPGEAWWRCIGSSPPLWIGLIGYARSRVISKRLTYCAVFLVILDVCLGLPLLPLNILFSVIFIRLLLDPAANLMLHGSKAKFWSGAFILLALWLPTRLFTSYGTAALALALVGYALRNKDKLADTKRYLHMFLFAIPFFILDQQLIAGYDQAQALVMQASVIFAFMLLFYFKPATFPKFDARFLAPIKGLLQICGRRTLEFYVLQTVIFILAAMTFGEKEFTPFNMSGVLPSFSTEPPAPDINEAE